MNIIELKTNNLEETFNQLKDFIGGDIISSNKEYVLKIDNGTAQGEIRGVSVNQNISFLEYDIVFEEDTVIVRNTPITNPITFLYCAKGQLSHSFGLNSKLRTLNKFQTGIFSSDPSKSNCLYFRKQKTVQVSSISVNTHPRTDENGSINLLQAQLLKSFMPKDGKEIFAYMGSYNLKIAEKMHEIDAINQQGIVRRLLIKGIVHVILALEIQQHSEDLKHSERNFGSLTRDEMDTISELSTFIQNYPERKYTLTNLSKKAGMSPAKLQEGFKLLHNRTVSDFIRNTRVETAEHLLKTTDLNISEIVYTIGLTSRSYFSKIFKEKYDCSPKYYQDHQNSVAVTA